MKIQTENSNLQRDLHSKALLNRNRGDLALNNQKRELHLHKEHRIETLEKDVYEIKEMIKAVLNHIENKGK
jgi:hypothetical protein